MELCIHIFCLKEFVRKNKLPRSNLYVTNTRRDTEIIIIKKFWILKAIILIEMGRSHYSFLYLSFLLQLYSVVCQTSENGLFEQSPKRSPSFSELDWDKFDHLYDIGPSRPDVPSTPPPELSKEAHLALSMLDHKQHSPTEHQAVKVQTMGQNKYQKLKAREQMKLEKMSEVERDAYTNKKRLKYRSDARRRREKMGYGNNREQSYGALRKLIKSNSANPKQIQRFKELKESNRIARRQKRQEHKERIKQARLDDKDGKLTPGQAEELKKYEENKEKMRKSSQHVRDRKKQMRLQAQERKNT